ncbi:acyl carrier protein [Pseudomonas viridiflava]|uniref:acyl carrier protein n=1 Tax=Pseudomonas viridiflava TaxID=33069 RepID=UPI0017867E51|nr:acyl carrier protein [Pseudomonas viridiflava]MBD8204106.1 acyl carrier protein [Pseudomonas viridiflava]
MDAEANRDELTQEIIELFVSIIGFIPREAVSAQTNFIKDFDIIDDDLTCFMMQVKWRYKLNPGPHWQQIATINEVVDLVLDRR